MATWSRKLSFSVAHDLALSRKDLEMITFRTSYCYPRPYSLSSRQMEILDISRYENDNMWLDTVYDQDLKTKLSMNHLLVSISVLSVFLSTLKNQKTGQSLIYSSVLFANILDMSETLYDSS